MQGMPNEGGEEEKHKANLSHSKREPSYTDTKRFVPIHSDSLRNNSNNLRESGSSVVNMSVGTQGFPGLYGYPRGDAVVDSSRRFVDGYAYRDPYRYYEPPPYATYMDPESQVYNRVPRSYEYSHTHYPHPFSQNQPHILHGPSSTPYPTSPYGIAVAEAASHGFNVSRIDQSYPLGVPGPSINHASPGPTYYPNMASYPHMQISNWGQSSSYISNQPFVDHSKDVDENSRSKSSSKYRGVYWNKNCKAWRARIWVSGKSEHLGNFDDEAEAARAFDRRARELGRTGLNFPDANVEELSLARIKSKRRKERNVRETSKVPKLAESGSVSDSKADSHADVETEGSHHEEVSDATASLKLGEIDTLSSKIEPIFGQTEVIDDKCQTNPAWSVNPDEKGIQPSNIEAIIGPTPAVEDKQQANQENET